MKMTTKWFVDAPAFCSGVLFSIVCWLWGVLPSHGAAPTPYTSTGWITGVPVAPLLVTNALGQVLSRGNTQTVMVQSTEPRLTGRRVVFVDGAFQADGTAIVYGSAYQEAGTWNLADPQNPKFTATGGLWEITYRGTMHTDNRLQLHLVGEGVGGNLEGLSLEEDLTRAAGAVLDPAIPYQYTGTLKAAPVDTVQLIDNFDDGRFRGTIFGFGDASEPVQQLAVRGAFSGLFTTSILNSYVVANPRPELTLTVPNGTTREWRTDLVSLDRNATNTAIMLLGKGTGLYGFHLGANFAYLLKYDGTVRILACEAPVIRTANVILAVALTRVQTRLEITARVLDKTNPNTVLYQINAVDTPEADPTLTPAQFQSVTGMRLTDVAPDQKGAPFSEFDVALGVFQFTRGDQPQPTAIFDNLEVRKSEAPVIGVSRAVLVEWPTTSPINYTVEGAPTVQGPWVPIPDILTSGRTYRTLPADAMTQFLRLRRAP